MRPTPDRSGPVEPVWVKPSVVRDAAFDMYSMVVGAQSQAPPLSVPELDHEYGEGLIAGIGNLVEELTGAISTNTLRIAADVGATVDAAIEADRSLG